MIENEEIRVQRNVMFLITDGDNDKIMDCIDKYAALFRKIINDFEKNKCHCCNEDELIWCVSEVLHEDLRLVYRGCNNES